MSNIPPISFCTPINFNDQPKSWSETLLEYADSYFYLGGINASIIDGAEIDGSKPAELISETPSLFTTALKVISYFTLVIPLIVIIAKTILRSLHTFHQMDNSYFKRHVPQNDSEKEQVKGIKLTNDELTILKNYATDPNNNPALEISNRFIKKSSYSLEFKCMVESRKICQENQLDLLVVPRGQPYAETKDSSYLVEEQLDVSYEESVEEERYEQLSDGLDEAIKQLATFIIQGGISSFSWDRGAILDHDPAFTGNRRIVLLNNWSVLDDKFSSSSEKENEARSLRVEEGLFGDKFTKRGLIGCLQTAEQIDLVINEAKKHGIETAGSEEQKQKRLREIEANLKLKAFYDEKGISDNPRKQIEIADLATLGVDLDRQGKGVEKPFTRKDVVTGKNQIFPPAMQEIIDDINKTYTMREAFTSVIETINRSISLASENATTKGKRLVEISFSNPDFRTIYPCDKMEKQNWLEEILKALTEKGHIFNYTVSKPNCFGRPDYFIQA